VQPDVVPMRMYDFCTTRDISEIWITIQGCVTNEPAIERQLNRDDVSPDGHEVVYNLNNSVAMQYSTALLGFD